MHEEFRKHLAIKDAKSLYHALRREARGNEPQVSSAVGETKQSLVAATCSIRRCPHNVMMADPLTNRLHTANLQPLLLVMNACCCTMGSELDEEEFRQQERGAGRFFLEAKVPPNVEKAAPPKGGGRKQEERTRQHHAKGEVGKPGLSAVLAFAFVWSGSFWALSGTSFIPLPLWRVL